jgi:hypothetical protein
MPEAQVEAAERKLFSPADADATACLYREAGFQRCRKLPHQRGARTDIVCVADRCGAPSQHAAVADELKAKVQSPKPPSIISSINRMRVTLSLHSLTQWRSAPAYLPNSAESCCAVWLRAYLHTASWLPVGDLWPSLVMREP